MSEGDAPDEARIKGLRDYFRAPTPLKHNRALNAARGGETPARHRTDVGAAPGTLATARRS